MRIRSIFLAWNTYDWQTGSRAKVSEGTRGQKQISYSYLSTTYGRYTELTCCQSLCEFIDTSTALSVTVATVSSKHNIFFYSLFLKMNLAQ